MEPLEPLAFGPPTAYFGYSGDDAFRDEFPHATGCDDFSSFHDPGRDQTGGTEANVGPPIVVYGTPPPPPPPPDWPIIPVLTDWPVPPPSPPPGPSATDQGFGTEPDPCQASDGEPMPEGDIEQIRAAAAGIGRDIGGATVEYVGAIYLFEGDVFQTSTRTDGRSDGVNADLALLQIPPGSTIVALVHNHPNGAILPSSTQSVGPVNDWSTAARLGATDWSSRGWSVDSNLLLYLTGPNGTFEYTQADNDTTNRAVGLPINGEACP